MINKNYSHSTGYQDDDDLDMDIGMDSDKETSDLGVDVGEKGGQATRDQSQTREAEEITGLRDEELDAGSDF